MSRNRRFNKKQKAAKQKLRHKKLKRNISSVKYTKRINNARQYVLNLSNKTLTDTEICILAKGLKFIPSNKVNEKKIMSDFKQFERNMRLKYHFSIENSKEIKEHPFKGKSKFAVPAIGDNPIEQYLFHTKNELSEYKPNTHKHNITLQERNCIKKLKSDTSICIHKADKGSVTVVQNSTDYIAEGLRQLFDGVHYKEIEKVDIYSIVQKVHATAFNLFEKGEIDEKSYKFLTTIDGKLKLPFAYFLPKVHKLDQKTLDGYNNNTIHKEKVSIPGRPIISQCNGPLRKIGRFLDYFLLPIVQLQDTYLSDTGDFIRNIESTTVTNNEALLIAYDITSLYTNLEFTEIIDSVKNALIAHEKIEYEIIRPNTESLINILELILKNNEFTFNEKSFKQIIGVGMGLNCSPEISDIAIYEHIENILKKFPHKEKIKLHKRMRDDGFIIFDGTRKEIESLFKLANESHKLLKFTYEIEENSISFLDTEVYKGHRFENSSVLDIKCYSKKTEKYQYLHRTSNHPQKCFKSFLKGETTRFLRNSSDVIEYKTRLKLFVDRLSQRGYHKDKVWQIINKISFEERQLKLVKRIKNKNTYSKNIFVTTYHSKGERLQRILKKFWYIIKRNPEVSQIFNEPPMVAFRTAKNIGQMIIKH